MVEFPGNILPTPGYTKTGFSQDDELLYSTHRFTQKGVTLLGGQGVLKLGTPLGRVTASKKWVAYTDAETGGVGSGVCRGFLRQTVDTGAEGSPDVQGNIVISGIIKLSKVTASGVALDANGIADLNGKSDTVMDTFTF